MLPPGLVVRRRAARAGPADPPVLIRQNPGTPCRGGTTPSCAALTARGTSASPAVGIDGTAPPRYRSAATPPTPPVRQL